MPLWLAADRTTPYYEERVRRDREIGRQIERSAALARVGAWWRLVAPCAVEAAGARLDRLRTVVTVAMTAVGIVTAVAFALAAFAYDGSQPVNVVRLLLLLVGVQLVLLAPTLLLLPGRVPDLRQVQDLLTTLNPGAWVLGAHRKLARASPHAAALLDRMGSPKIETAGREHDVAPTLAIGAVAAATQPLTGTACALISENSLTPDPARDYARRHLGLAVRDVAEAGAGRLASDRAMLEHIAADCADTLLVFTPAWEPPLL